MRREEHLADIVCTVGHCALCSKMIDIAAVNKYLDLALIQEEVPETLKNHYDLLEHQASECIECGLCMKKCPSGMHRRILLLKTLDLELTPSVMVLNMRR